MSTCDYAACAKPATTHADGWNFCRSHLTEHRLLELDQPLPASAPVFPQELFRPSCGTMAAARRHNRAGEPVCARCSEATVRWNMTQPGRRRLRAS